MAKHCDADKSMPGSIGPAPFPIYVIQDPNGGPPLLESTTCLLPQIDTDTWQLFKLYKLYQKGLLLRSGGLLDQPARYLETMDLIETASQPDD